MNVTAMGRAGLTGWKGKAAERISEPVARKTPLRADQIQAVIGGVLLALTTLQYVRLMRRVWSAREESTGRFRLAA